ncbi:MAG: MFS transporter [Acidimicrobiales bacterium]
MRPAPQPRREAGFPAATLAAATLSITLAALPVFLLGALAVFVRDELGFAEARLGAAASVYYLASALASVPGGRLAERLGARRSIGVAAAGTAAATLGIALVATSWSRLVGCLVVAGAANGVALPATNLTLARRIPASRQGVSFGLKQSSGPIATLVAGLSVPALGLTMGWRWAFAFAGGAAVILATAALGGRPGPHQAARRDGDVPTGPLVLLSLAAASAVVAGSALGAFFVESAVANGIPTAVAGSLLAGGSVLGVVARVAWGWVGDLRPSGHLRLVGLLQASGALGFALLGPARSYLVLIPATVLVFCAGWAWPGVFNFAVVRRSPGAPAAASGVTGMGQFAGGIVGPLGFGALVEWSSYVAAWAAASVAMLVAGLLVVTVDGWLSGLGADRPMSVPGPPPSHGSDRTYNA